MNVLLKEKLKRYSSEVFGVSSRWAKMIDEPKYRIVVKEEPIDDVEYLSYKSSTGKQTVVRTDTARELGLPLPDISGGSIKYTWRKPTPEEILFVLEAGRLELARSYLMPADRARFVAFYMIIKKALPPRQVLLYNSDYEQEQAVDTFGAWIKPSLVSESPSEMHVSSALDVTQQYKLGKLLDIDKQDAEFENIIQTGLYNRSKQVGKSIHMR